MAGLRLSGLPASRRKGRRHVCPSPATPSLAVIGFLETASGLGAAGRGMCHVLADRGPLPVSISALSRTARVPSQSRPSEMTDAGSMPGHEVAIHVHNPDVFLAAVRRYGTRFLRANSLNIAVVNWETDCLPPRWADVLSLYDVLCAPSLFTARAVERATRRSVSVVPIFVPVKPPRVRVRGDSVYEFLCMFDFRSDFERKNPLAAVRAFRAAVRSLPQGSRCRLRIKCHTGTPSAIVARLRQECGPDPIEILDETLSESQMALLWQDCDCLVSLHRSEGFGLPVAEALARSIPVITTRQGGVLDFVDDSGCFFVDGPAAKRPYSGSDYAEWSGWVEPNMAAAAAHMVAVVRRYDEAATRGQRGRERLIETTSADVVRAAIEQAIASAGGPCRP